MSIEVATEVTLRHPKAQFGRPVVLDQHGEVLRDSLALKRFMSMRKYTARSFSHLLGGTWTPHSVRAWRREFRPVPVEILNVIGMTLEDERAALLRKRWDKDED